MTGSEAPPRENVLRDGQAHAGYSARAADVTARRQVALWLFICCALLCALVVVGGVTRLTHSGLSITEWQPIAGTLPPLSDADWDEAFAKYRATPEYRLVNFDMDLPSFKRIFWWEFVHRLLGRAIGVAYLIPLVGFVFARRIPRGYLPALFGIFALGAAQGALGWYMVLSGLVDDPRVSQFRLTAHLGLAFLIFAAMFWTALSLVRPAAIAPADGSWRRLRGAATGLAALVFVMVLSGGLVAGIRAGLAYNTFPLMNGNIVPPEILMIDPAWRNFFWNIATVQFDHRLIAWALAIVGAGMWWTIRARQNVSAATRRGAHLLFAALVVQITLGIATLLLIVPLPLAAAHQAGALLVFGGALNLAHSLRSRHHV